MDGEPLGADAARFEQLGVYDPADPDAPRRLGVLRDLVDLGATDEDLRDSSDGLGLLALRLVTRTGAPLTAGQVAERAAVTEARVLAVWQAAGFQRPDPEEASFTDADVDLVRLVERARDLFGDDTTLQLIRVTGSAISRVADAVISAFIVDLASHSMVDDPSGTALVRANLDALALVPEFSDVLDTLLRHHLLGLRRTEVPPGPPGGYETQDLAVGFSDLVDSSELAQHVSMTELGTRLRRFETRAADVVTSGGGRLIKHIGDEVMFVVGDAAGACRIALELLRAFAEDPDIPPLRSGVATGEVLVRDGDYFGPVVNLAARLVHAAPVNTLLVSEPVRAELRTARDLVVTRRAPRPLKGFGEAQPVYEVSRA